MARAGVSVVIPTLRRPAELERALVAAAACDLYVTKSDFAEDIRTPVFKAMTVHKINVVPQR